MKNYAGRNISFSIIFPNFFENCRDSEYSQWRHKNASENSKIFRRTFEKYSRKFVANLTQFLPESKVSSEKIMEKFLKFLAEIPGGDKALSIRCFLLTQLNCLE